MSIYNYDNLAKLRCHLVVHQSVLSADRHGRTNTIMDSNKHFSELYHHTSSSYLHKEKYTVILAKFARYFSVGHSTFHKTNISNSS